MRTESLIIVFIFILGSCNLRQFLVETVDNAEHGADYNENYHDDYFYYDSRGEPTGMYATLYLATCVQTYRGLCMGRLSY